MEFCCKHGASLIQMLSGIPGKVGGAGAGGKWHRNRVQPSGSIPQNQIHEILHKGKYSMLSLEDDRLFFS